MSIEELYVKWTQSCGCKDENWRDYIANVKSYILGNGFSNAYYAESIPVCLENDMRELSSESEKLMFIDILKNWAKN